jgi:hypothetical protein
MDRENEVVLAGSILAIVTDHRGADLRVTWRLLALPPASGMVRLTGVLS